MLNKKYKDFKEDRNYMEYKDYGKYKDLKITDVSFVKKQFQTEVTVELENKETIDLFFFYKGEVDYSKDELVDLTVSEALDLRYKKDLNYIYQAYARSIV